VKLAFSSNAFRSFPIEDTIDLLAGIGYRGVELMADRPHAWPPDMTPERIGSVREALAKHRMEVSNVNAFMMCAYRHPVTGRAGTFQWPSWIDPDPAVREARIRHTIEAVDVAAAVGARTISIQPGGPLEGMGREEACRLFAEGLRRAADRGREQGVTVCIEPEPKLLIERGDEYVEFVSKHATFPGVGLNFDLGHSYCVGDDPAEMIRKLGRRADHFHLEDIAADRVHFHLPPGDGAMDFKGIFAALREIRYGGWVTVELYPFQENPVEVARRAHEFIRPFAEHVSPR
jgi:sugar phosphate isomerase/epimerase